MSFSLQSYYSNEFLEVNSKREATNLLTKSWICKLNTGLQEVL